ncbi:hypothetical protein D3C75_652930 [compost metagenome]
MFKVFKEKMHFKKDFLFPLLRMYLLFILFLVLFAIANKNRDLQSALEETWMFVYSIILIFIVFTGFGQYRDAKSKFAFEQHKKLIFEYRDTYDEDEVIKLNIKHVNKIVGNDVDFWGKMILIQKLEDDENERNDKQN